MTKKTKKRPRPGEKYRSNNRTKVAAIVKAEPYASAIFAAILVIIAARLLLIQIDRPWIGLHDFNGAYWSNVARNWIRYGIIDTKFAQIINYGPLQPQNYEIYAHHPPLLPLLLVVAFRLFGESEAVARYVPLAFSLGTVVFIFMLGRYFWGFFGGLVSAAMLIAVPHFLYFGKMVDHEALVFFFIMGAAYFYSRWRDSQERSHLVLMSCMLIGGALSDWPAYYFMAGLFVLDIVLERRLRTAMLIIPIIILTSGALFAINIILLKGFSGSLADLIDIIKLRTGNVSGPRGSGFTWSGLALRQFYRMKNEFTWSLSAASALATAVLVWIRSSKSKTYLGLVIVFWFTALFHILMFPHGAWNHNYWNFYLLGPLCLPTAAFGSFALKTRWQNVVAFVLGALLLCGLVWQSLQTTMYAYQAEIDYNVLILGQAIHANSDFNTLVMVDLEYIGPKTSYYADRNIIWSIYKPTQLENAIKAHPGRKIVFVDAGTAPELAPYLKERYRSKELEREKLTIYEIQ